MKNYTHTNDHTSNNRKSQQRRRMIIDATTLNHIMVYNKHPNSIKKNKSKDVNIQTFRRRQTLVIIYDFVCESYIILYVTST